MKRSVDFCTCTSLDCPHHPTNHDAGCTPCIEKNLRTGEIPGCFFHKVEDERQQLRKGDTIRDFAELVLENR